MALIVGVATVAAGPVQAPSLKELRSSDTSAQPPSESPAGARTATVTRTDLVEQVEFDGRMGYGPARPVAAPSDGVLTWVPPVGSVVRAGEPLLGIDGLQRILLHGGTPAWRDLSRGVEGPDVVQLQENLVALVDAIDITVDGEFGASTARAVRMWQADRGVPQTGRIEREAIVFLPAPVRVTAHPLAPGAHVAAGTTALEVGSTERAVVFRLPTDQLGLVRVGDDVRVAIPAVGTRRGEVVAIGDEASVNGSEGRAAVDVTVRLADAVDGPLSSAPVRVSIEEVVAADVLVVPVTALLALAEGGYGIEVLRAGIPQLVQVEVGALAQGLVQIRGAVSEGDEVVDAR